MEKVFYDKNSSVGGWNGGHGRQVKAEFPRGWSFGPWKYKWVEWTCTCYGQMDMCVIWMERFAVWADGNACEPDRYS